jgi:hypothetical protein
MQNFGFYYGICLEGLTEDMMIPVSIMAGSVTDSWFSGSIGFNISQFYRSGSHISLAMIPVPNFYTGLVCKFWSMIFGECIIWTDTDKFRNKWWERCTSNNAIQNQKSLTMSLSINIKHSELKHTQEVLYFS